MRDPAFFQQVEHLERNWRGGTIKLPIFYYDVTTIVAGFLTPLEKVRALLPSQRMKPLQATPWHAVTTIVCFEYRDSDIGPYNEVAITFPITIDRPAPILRGLLRHVAEGPLAYVHHLPVTTEPAYYAGVDFYNYPKFIAKIDFQRSDGWLSCRLSEGDRHILTVTARQLPVRPFDHWCFHGITVRDERILRSEIIVNVGRQAISRRAGNVNLELGSHPISKELRDLRMGRMIHFQYLPENQAILTPVLETYPSRM
jgi:hypothetical protein